MLCYELKKGVHGMDSLTHIREEKLKTVSHFSQRIVHELNNISTILFNACDFLKEDMSGNASALKNIDMLENASARMLALSSELKSLRFVTEKIIEHSDVNKTIEEVVRPYKSFVFTLCDPKHPRALVSAERLKIILLSLVQNAMEASEPGAPIYIESKQQDAQIIIEVRDEGRGMTTDQLRQLGDPFFSSKQHTKGAGLSLSKIYYWLSTSKGSMHFKSTVGVGTTVTLTLTRHS